MSGWPSGSSTVQVCFSALFSSKGVGLWTLPSNLTPHDKLKGSFQCSIVHSGSKCSARSSSQHSRQISFKTKTKQNLLTKKEWRKPSSVRKSAAVRHVYSPDLSLTSDLRPWPVPASHLLPDNPSMPNRQMCASKPFICHISRKLMWLIKKREKRKSLLRSQCQQVRAKKRSRPKILISNLHTPATHPLHFIPQPPTIKTFLQLALEASASSPPTGLT